jgi:uncharacterized membrane protein
MRRLADRIRHALSFEIIGLLIIVPLGALVFDKPMQDIGVVGVVSATLATLWNMAYNYGFDLMQKRRTGSTQKGYGVRIIHAVLFETGLLIVLLPFIAWYLGLTLWAAFVMDISFAGFYLVYAYLFNLAYDRLFQMPEWSDETAR